MLCLQAHSLSARRQQNWVTQAQTAEPPQHHRQPYPSNAASAQAFIHFVSRYPLLSYGTPFYMGRSEHQPMLLHP